MKNRQQAGSLQLQVNDFYKEIYQFEEQRVKELTRLLTQIQTILNNDKNKSQRIQFLLNTLKRIKEAQSVDEVKVYQESFLDVLKGIQLDTDPLNIDEWINAVDQYVNAGKISPSNLATLKEKAELASQDSIRVANELMQLLEEKFNRLRALAFLTDEQQVQLTELNASLTKIKLLRVRITEIANTIANVPSAGTLAELKKIFASEINHIRAIATHTPDILQYRNKQVKNYLVNQCEENLISYCIARSSYMQTIKQQERAALKFILKKGAMGTVSLLVGAGEVADIIGHGIKLASKGHDVFELLHSKFVEKVTVPASLSFSKKIRSTISIAYQAVKSIVAHVYQTFEHRHKENPVKTLGLAMSCGALCALPFIFFPWMLALALLSFAVTLVGVIYAVISRGKEERDKDQKVTQRLAEHEKDLTDFIKTEKLYQAKQGKSQPKWQSPSRVRIAIDYSKKHPWAIPLVVGGSIVGWKVATAAIVVAGAKMMMGGSSLLFAKATGATAAGVATAGVETAVVKRRVKKKRTKAP